MSGESTGSVCKGSETKATNKKEPYEEENFSGLLVPFVGKHPGSKCFKASSRVEILLSFSYLFSHLPEHMFPHSFISKWRIHHCPKSVVWLALLNGRFCVTRVYFILFQTICFLLVCLPQRRRSSQQRYILPLQF